MFLEFISGPRGRTQLVAEYKPESHSRLHRTGPTAGEWYVSSAMPRSVPLVAKSLCLHTRVQTKPKEEHHFWTRNCAQCFSRVDSILIKTGSLALPLVPVLTSRETETYSS